MNPAARPTLYFHTFWTRPQRVDSRRTGAELIGLPDFEALTWLTSALEAGRHGRIRLITDLRGLQFIRNVGLDWVYTGGISTELEAIPETINPEVFWSAGKLYAWRTIGEAAVSLDPDAICWQAVEAMAPVVVLHAEDPFSEDYCFQRQRYGPFGFEGPEWDWEVEPMNAGVVLIEEPAFARRYADEAIRFMSDFSAALRAGFRQATSVDGCWGDAMLFAEQRLLSMLMRQCGLRGAALAECDPRRQHMGENPRCLHLWGTKRFYPRCRDARVAYANHLIRHLGATFPESVETLKRWRLDRPLTVESQPPDPDPVFPLKPGDDGYCRLGRIDGSVDIQDANLGVKRRGYPGAIVGAAELLYPGIGTSFELTEVRYMTTHPSQPGFFHTHATQDPPGGAPEPVCGPDLASGSGKTASTSQSVAGG